MDKPTHKAGELPRIGKPWMEAVCKPGAGAATCRYIVAGARGLECAKGSTMQPTIDARVAAGTFTARADNCSGAPDFTPCC